MSPSMSSLLLLSLVASASAQTVASCYGGAACTGHGCCDCDETQASCTGSWSSSCTRDMCATDTIPNIPGCYGGGDCPSGGHGCCDCSVSQAQCTTGTWTTSCFGRGTGCDITALAVPTSPPAPPKPPTPPPTPPSKPPSPPQTCIVEYEGQTLPKTTPSHPDPVNEPCYSHNSCKNYKGVGSGYICCVQKGTCDNLVSNSARYYEGGCIGLNYKRFNDSIVNTSTSVNAPSTVQGCAVQGECHLPYLEQQRVWTADGGPLKRGAIPDEVMDRLLSGPIIESPKGGCRDVYPRTAVTATHDAVMMVSASGDVADYTTAVLTGMKRSVALQLGVAKENVDIKASAGSVVLTITVGYASSTAADTAKSTMSAMSTSDVTTMLTTSDLAVTVAAVQGVMAGDTTTSPPPPSPPPPPPTSPSDDNTGMVVGVAIGASVGAIAIVGAIYVIMSRKSSAAAQAAAKA